VAEVVILTGFMGSGRSVTGRELAALLGWEFVDLEDEVERPLLQISASEGQAREFFDARRPLYASVGRQVDTESKTPEAAAWEIRERFLGGPAS